MAVLGLGPDQEAHCETLVVDIGGGHSTEVVIGFDPGNCMPETAHSPLGL